MVNPEGNNLSFIKSHKFRTGCLNFIIGKSGVGKTTFLLALAGLNYKTSGDLMINLNNKYKLRLVDCFEDNFMMDYTKLEKKITSKTKVIIVVHLYGHSADMDKIMDIAKKYNLVLIEDAAQAHRLMESSVHIGKIVLEVNSEDDRN